MKNIKNQCLLLLLTCFGISSYAQEKQNFTTTPAAAKNGETIVVNYDAQNTPLKDKQKIDAVVYQYNNYKWEAIDLPFQGSGNQWKATLKVPENCGLMAFKFKSDTLTDNNKDQGYFLLLHDKDREGAMAPGAYAAYGFARSPNLNRDIPGYMNFAGITDTASYYWISQEISFNQGSKTLLSVPYASTAKSWMKDGANERLRLVMTFLTRPEASEDELLKARNISMNVLADTKKKDSVEQLLNTRFPKGSLARLKAYRAISTHKEIPAVMKASEQFLKDFPEAQTNATFDEENFIKYGVVYQNLIILGSLVDKNSPYLTQYVNNLSYGTLNNVYYKIVTIPFNRKEGSMKDLLNVSEILMKRYDYLLSHRPSEYSHLSPSEWSEEFNKTQAKYNLSTHASLLMTAGRDEEALKCVLFAQQYLKYKDATLNDEQAQLLQKQGKTAELEELLQKSLFENQSTPEMIAILKEIYVKKNKSESGFDQYVEQLKNPADKLAAEKSAAAEMINTPLPDWSMEDMNGKTVHFKDLRGKVVVMDFWATWCVPCKASFPGMKIAVEKYKNDPDVVFFFVDTEEHGSTFKDEVRKYIKDNNFPFQVLFDNQAKGAKTNGEVFGRICKAFTISGIPQKLFIDKKGNLRLISVGYKGSATALADDISMMVELTRNAK